MTNTIDKLSQFNELQAQLSALQSQIASLAQDPDVLKKNEELSSFQTFVKDRGYSSIDEFVKTLGFVREEKKTTRKVLPYETKKLILERHNKGESASSLGAEFGIGSQTIYQWKTKGLKAPGTKKKK